MENSGETLHSECKGMRLRTFLSEPALVTEKGSSAEECGCFGSPQTHKETSVSTVADTHQPNLRCYLLTIFTCYTSRIQSTAGLMDNLI